MPVLHILWHEDSQQGGQQETINSEAVNAGENTESGDIKGDRQREGWVANRASTEEVGIGTAGTSNIQVQFLRVNLVNLGH